MRTTICRMGFENTFLASTTISSWAVLAILPTLGARQWRVKMAIMAEKTQLSRGIILMIRTFNRQRKLSMIIFTLEFSLLVKSAGHERNNRGCKIIIVHTMVANHPHYESWWSLPCVRHWITAVQKRSPPFLPPKAKDALQMRSCKSGAIIHFLLSRNYKIVFFWQQSSTNLQYWAHSSFVIGSSSHQAEHLVS